MNTDTFNPQIVGILQMYLFKRNDEEARCKKEIYPGETDNPAGNAGMPVQPLAGAGSDLPGSYQGGAVSHVRRSVIAPGIQAEQRRSART